MTITYLPRWPRRHPERDYEDEVLAYLQSREDILEIGRQVRIPGHGVADLVIYTEFPDAEEADGIARMMVVIEVKAGRAGTSALKQLTRYMVGLQTYFADDRISYAGAIAAPSFDPSIEAFAADPTTSFNIFRLGAT